MLWLLSRSALKDVFWIIWPVTEIISIETTPVTPSSNSISKFLLKELYGYKQNCTDERLFDNREVNSALIKEYSKHFSNLFKSLGINNFTYHNLRHCFSTFQSDSGADAFTTQSLLGHASLSQTAQYTHTRMEIKRNNIETMTEYILKMNEKTKITNFSSDQGTT